MRHGIPCGTVERAEGHSHMWSEVEDLTTSCRLWLSLDGRHCRAGCHAVWDILLCGVPFRAPKLSRSSWTRSVRAEGCCKIRSRSPSASTRPVRVRPLQPGAARVALLQGCSVVIICNTTAQHAATPPLATCMHPAACNMREASSRSSLQRSLLKQACTTRKAMASRRRWSGR